MKRRTLVASVPVLALAASSLVRAQAPVRLPDGRSVVSADGTRIAYSVSGEGPDVVLLHGLMGSRASWYVSGYGEALERHYRVIAVDMRGHGDSDGPTDPERYGYAALASDIAAVVEQECTSPTILWGYSAGGGLAMACAAHHPSLYRKVVVGGSYRAAVGFPEGATEAMVANARRIGASATDAQARTAVSMRGQNIAAIAAFLEKGAHFDPVVQAALRRYPGEVLLYLGAEDAAQLHAHEQVSGVQLGEFFMNLRYVELPGTLSHGEAFDQADVVLPYVLPFLAGA